MRYRNLMKIFHVTKCVVFPSRNWDLHFDRALYNCYGDAQEQVLSLEGYSEVFSQVERLSQKLQNVDLIDGVLVNSKTDKVIVDDGVKNNLYTLKSLMRVLIGCPSVQRKLRGKLKAFSAEAKCGLIVPFSRTGEREPMVFSSLTKVGNFLNIAAQQRKIVRVTICPQVTQHHIWAGALEMILNRLKLEMDCSSYKFSDKQANMVQQMVLSCIKLVTSSDASPNQDSASWVWLAPTKHIDSLDCPKWEDVRKMFIDLIRFLDGKKDLFSHIEKLIVMKEGLYQIKDVLINKEVGYKVARHQESLIQKKLSQTLGYSSHCLFTLLLYYLFQKTQDVEVDMCGGMYGIDGGKQFRVCLGRILTSDEEMIVWNGMKQLDMALGLLKFVWETAERKEPLELEGHLWCVGVEDRIIKYRGNSFFIHGISL